MELRPFFLILTHPSKGSWHPKRTPSRPGHCRTPSPELEPASEPREYSERPTEHVDRGTQAPPSPEGLGGRFC